MKKIPRISLTSISKIIGQYKLTIFIVVFVGGLVSGVLILNQILTGTSDTTGLSSSYNLTTFDQATIERVEKLRTSSEPMQGFSIPNARYNPFSE